MKLNWKLLLLPLAAVVETASALVAGRETGFGNWVFDREIGDRQGNLWHKRKPAKPVTIH